MRSEESMNDPPRSCIHQTWSVDKTLIFRLQIWTSTTRFCVEWPIVGSPTCLPDLVPFGCFIVRMRCIEVDLRPFWLLMHLWGWLWWESCSSTDNSKEFGEGMQYLRCKSSTGRKKSSSGETFFILQKRTAIKDERRDAAANWQVSSSWHACTCARSENPNYLYFPDWGSRKPVVHSRWWYSSVYDDIHFKMMSTTQWQAMAISVNGISWPGEWLKAEIRRNQTTAARRKSKDSFWISICQLRYAIIASREWSYNDWCILRRFISSLHYAMTMIMERHFT